MKNEIAFDFQWEFQLSLLNNKKKTDTYKKRGRDKKSKIS